MYYFFKTFSVIPCCLNILYNLNLKYIIDITLPIMKTVGSCRDSRGRHNIVGHNIPQSNVNEWQRNYERLYITATGNDL